MYQTASGQIKCGTGHPDKIPDRDDLDSWKNSCSKKNIVWCT